MKDRIKKKFQWEIIWYAIESLCYTVLMEGGILLIVYLINSQFSTRKNNGANAVNGVQQVIPSSDGIKLGMVFLIFVLGVALFFVFFLYLTRNIGMYMKQIITGIEEMTSGNFVGQIQIDGANEFSDIADHLNLMAKQIQHLMEEEHHNDALRTELITSVAHDLRTPLTSIIGYLDLVSNNDKIDVSTKERYAAIAFEKSKRLEKLIEDLFAYTKITCGEIACHKAKIDLVKFMEQLSDEFYPSLMQNSLDFEFQCKIHEMPFYGDGDLLSRAFANLLSNAIKYGQDGKRIEIFLTAEPSWYKIQIVNYGEIIPSADLKHIFDRFYRVENSRSVQTGGSGLGLAIAKGIIQMHDGIIEASSDHTGTKFTVQLPRKGEDEAIETEIQR